jgi:uncharacterized membrane-anchored protein YjiN (DUF445 family)
MTAPHPPNAGPQSFDPQRLDPQAARRADLVRYRRYANGALLLAALILAATYALPAHWPPTDWWRDLVQAAAKAGVVGGIADWFAVTALFRHPLGIALPHTAIIPRQKERLARGLSRFLTTHFFTEAEIRAALERLDLAKAVGAWLAQPDHARQAGQGIAGALPTLMTSFEDGRAVRLATRLVPRLGAGLAPKLLGRGLAALVEGGRHHALLDFLLATVRDLMREKEGALKAEITARVKDQVGNLAGWAVAPFVARRALGAAHAELERMGLSDSDLRAAFDEWVRREISRIENDPERAAEIGAAVRRALGNQVVHGWVADVWGRLRAGLAADAAKDSGRVADFAAGAVANLGRMLQEDPATAARLNEAVSRALAALIPELRGRIEDTVQRVAGQWSGAELAERIELTVGRDLQWVRINGTIVGALVGALLWAVLTLAFGRAAI